MNSFLRTFLLLLLPVGFVHAQELSGSDNPDFQNLRILTQGNPVLASGEATEEVIALIDQYFDSANCQFSTVGGNFRDDLGNNADFHIDNGSGSRVPTTLYCSPPSGGGQYIICNSPEVSCSHPEVGTIKVTGVHYYANPRTESCLSMDPKEALLRSSSNNSSGRRLRFSR